MNKEDIQKLIGGYATGSLTDEERHILFEAALDDQELFDTLQQEQALKDLFDDPFSREQVRRAAAESVPQPQTSGMRRSSWFRPTWIWASATSAALAGVLVFALVRWDRTQPPQIVKQPEVAANKPQPAAAEPTTLPDREKRASEPPAPKPRVIAGKAPAGTVPGLDDKSPADRKAGTLQTRRSSSGGFGRGEASGHTTSSGDRAASRSPELSRNREEDAREPLNNRKNSEGGGGAGQPQVRSGVAPANSTDTTRNSNESPRNTADAPRNATETPRNYAETARNTVQLPRKDDQVAALPASQSQLERGRSQSGPSQIQQPQQVQAPPPSPEVSYRSQPNQIPASRPAPPPPSQPRDSEEKLHRETTVKTEATDEMMRVKTASPSKLKDAGSRSALAKTVTPAMVSFYSLARRSEDGSYTDVSSNTVFQPGDFVRLTIMPRVSEPLTIEESDSANPAWRQVYPADADKAGVSAKEGNVVAVDFVVSKNQRIRVKVGSEVTSISIKTGRR